MSRLFNQNGYTLIELMLAMSIFITVMVIATAGFVGINRTFTRGVLRKQLSEGVQRTTEEITKSLRASQTIDHIAEGNFAMIKIGATCYKWESDDEGKTLKRLVGGCEGSESIELLDERYQVDYLNVAEVNPDSDSNLYRVSGIFRTIEEDAFDKLEGYDEAEGSAKFDKIYCKGTAASEGRSDTCALEKFEFVVNAKGGV